MYLKVPAWVFALFPNKSACIYDNKHASKQIPWIDEFKMKRIFNYEGHPISSDNDLIKQKRIL